MNPKAKEVFEPGSRVRVLMVGVLRKALGQDRYEVYVPELNRTMEVGPDKLVAADH